MLKLVKKIKKGKPTDCTFDRAFENQKIGIEMLMCCNMNNRDCVTGPEVGLDANIITQREKPHYLFNPRLTDDGDIAHSDYLGNETVIEEPAEYLLNALEQMNAK